MLYVLWSLGVVVVLAVIGGLIYLGRRDESDAVRRLNALLAQDARRREEREAARRAETLRKLAEDARRRRMPRGDAA